MQRYNGIEADDDGVYVLHEDATKRIAELEAALQDRGPCRDCVGPEDLREAEIERDALKAKVKELEALFSGAEDAIKALQEEVQKTTEEASEQQLKDGERIAELEAKLGDMNKRRLHWIEIHGGDSIRIEEMLAALKDAKDQVNYLMCCFAPTRADAENTAAVIRDIDAAIAKAQG